MVNFKPCDETGVTDVIVLFASCSGENKGLPGVGGEVVLVLSTFPSSGRTALEGASSRSVTSPGLRGYYPSFLEATHSLAKPLQRVMPICQVLMGFLARYLLQALEK